MDSKRPKSQNSGPFAPCALWPVDLKLTHLDWNPEATLIHFQGQYLTICELDYNILQGEIQNIPKTKAALDIGQFCLVEDFTSARWYRGRVQNRKEDLFDVFLIDHGNVLSVNIDNISSCSNKLFDLPPKIVCGFLANVLLHRDCSHSVVEKYFSTLTGRKVTGYIKALLPNRVLLLEAPDINIDLFRHGFGRHVDTDTFLLLVEMLTEVPLKQNTEPVPDLLIEKPREQEFWFQLSGLHGYEDILSFCGPRLNCGTHAKVCITAAVNPSLFYCQMANMESDLCEMSKKLAAACENRTKETNQKTPENLGLLCSVKGKDGLWYRGFVQYLPFGSQVRVFFIDYGFFEYVKVDDVHRLPPNCDSTPIMAFRCSLFSMSDQDEAVKTRQLSFFKAGLLGRVLDAEIRSFDEKSHLYSIRVIGVNEESYVRKSGPIQDLSKVKIESTQGGYLYCETIMGIALGETLEAEDMKEGSVFVGYVEHVQNPNHFWIRTQKRNDEFEDMMTKMADHFSQVKLDEDVLLNPELGTLCCAVYEEDMHFYRSVVTDTLEHGAEVLFVDFGNIEKVPYMLIKKIPKKFASHSAFAFCCTLANVSPLDEVWTSTVCDFFRQAVSNKALLVHVIKMRSNKFVVDLYEMGSDNKRSVAELLMSSKQAEQWSNIHIEPVVQGNRDVTEKAWFPRCKAAGIIEISEQLGDCTEEEKTCKKETERAPAPASFKSLSIKPGCEFAVCLSYITSPSDFWCQPSVQVPALEELMDKIQQYYSAHTAILQSGDLCCVARSPRDGRWYRAFITEKQRDRCRVMLVDYGWAMQIKEQNLQAILPEYLYLEGQAFRCSLYNLIKPADQKSCGDWSPEVCSLFKEFVLNSTSGVRCKVVSQMNVKNKGLCNVVDLYNTQTLQSITNLLLGRGLAREVTVSTLQLSTVFPESFVFSSFDLNPGDEEQVYVTHVSSQWEVFCHLERNTEIIEELEQKISEESKKMMQASTRAVVRKLCLAKYFDGRWYRGLATMTACQSPLHLSVFFVDYGNINISEKTHVMLIPRDSAELLYTPMQAVRCSLVSVSKEELYPDVKEWLVGAVLNKQVRAVIVGKSKEGSFDVELFDGDVNINEKLNELILSLAPKPKTAVSFDLSNAKMKPKALHTRTINTSVKGRSRCKGHSPNYPRLNVKRGTQNVNVPCSKKENTKCVPQAEHCKSTKNQNEESTKSVDVKHQKNRQRENYDANTKSEQPSTKDSEIAQLPCVPHVKVREGFRAKCFVSHINSVNSFFLQLSEDEPAILKMCEDLNTGVRDYLKINTSLRINDLVLAEYEEDGALYRSAVTGYEGSSCFKVEFVDYGNSAVIVQEKIYSLSKKYLSQPRFSISCSLFDTSMHKNHTSFSDAVMDKPLMVDFVCQYGDLWQVKLMTIDGAVGPPSSLHTLAESAETTETKEEAPATSSQIEEEMKFCELNCFIKEESENETNKSERMMPAFDDKKSIMLNPPPAKLKVIPCRRYGRKIRSKMDLKKNQRKTLKSSVKAKRDWVSDWADAIIPQPSAKDTVNVTVLSVLGNGSFYIRLKTCEVLAAVESHIADNIHKCKMVAEEDVKQGLRCFVQGHKDRQWRRAIVQHVGQGRCQILLVDHGISEEISSRSIRQQCSNLTNVPNLAVLCKMNCFGCETIKPMIGKEVKVVFKQYAETEQIWKVEMVINGLLHLCQNTTSLQQNKEMTQKDKADKKSSLDTSHPQQLVFIPVDIDKVYFGLAASVTTPFEFCIVLEDLLLIMNKVSMVLDNLPELSPLPEAHLVPGTCCLLKSGAKSKWCRAEIIHVDNTVVLNLVDYGHDEYMPYENCSELKRFPEEIMNLPKVSYPCILRGVKPVRVDGQWTEEAAVFFQQCLYQKNLKIFFRESVSDTHWKVDILADGVYVAQELVDAGHANYIDIMLGLRFQVQSPCKHSSHRHDSEEDEFSDEKSDEPESSDKAEEKVPLSALSGSKQCLLM